MRASPERRVAGKVEREKSGARRRIPSRSAPQRKKYSENEPNRRGANPRGQAIGRRATIIRRGRNKAAVARIRNLSRTEDFSRRARKRRLFETPRRAKIFATGRAVSKMALDNGRRENFPAMK